MSVYKKILAGGATLAVLGGIFGSPVFASESPDKPATYEYYDIDLTSSAATLELIAEIECIEPFGVGNQSPTFRFSNLYVLKADIVGAKHIRVVFAPEREAYGSKPLTAIAFNVVGTEMGNKLLSRKPHAMSVFGKLKVNKWQDRETVQLQLSDLLVIN